MKKIGKILAGSFIFTLVTLTIAISYLKNTVPDGYELREFVYLDCSTFVNVMWIIATIGIVVSVFRGILQTDTDGKSQKVLPIVGMILVTLTAIFLIGVRITINNFAAEIEGKESVNPDGTLTVVKDFYNDNTITAIYTKEGFLYRKIMEHN